MIRNYFLSIMLLLCCNPSQAQNVFETLNDTVMVSTQQTLTSSEPILDKKWNSFQTKYFTMNVGVAIFLDYNTLNQDSNNITQVSKVADKAEFRGDRLIVSGNLLFFKNPWKYYISANYNGLDSPDEKPVFSIIDLSVEIPFGKKSGWLIVGKQKEGIGHEYLIAGSQGMFMERGSGVPALIKQRNYGLRYGNSILDERLTVNVGVFNNWIENGNHNSFSDNGIRAIARVSGLPYFTSNKNLMHVGVGYLYSESTAGTLSYKAKPEVNTAPSFINTGAINASSANMLMLEWIGVKGPLSAIAEYMTAFVNTNDYGTANFNYWQVSGSWFLTGESRNYNKRAGCMGKLIPAKNFTFAKGGGLGAIEFATRYTKSDFNDSGIKGGDLGRVTVAMGWYPNASFRFEVNYGNATLKKNELTGNTGIWQFRAQFEL